MRITKGVLNTLRTARDIQVLVEGVTGTSESNILPVVTLEVLEHVHIFPVTELACVVVNFRLVAVVVEHCILILPLSILIRTENVNLLSDVLDAVESIITNLCLTSLTAICGNEDYTVSTTRTVDGCRRSILQHCDVLDVACRNITDTVNGESVNDIKRVVALCDRTTTTHANLHLSVRRTFGCCYLHTCHFTGECL